MDWLNFNNNNSGAMQSSIGAGDTTQLVSSAPNLWDQFSNLMGNAVTTQGPNGQPMDGWGLNALNAGNGLLQSWLGFEQLGLAQDQFDFQKNAWQSQYNDNVALANAQMRDRQATRYYDNPNFYQDPDTYMEQNKVGG